MAQTKTPSLRALRRSTALNCTISRADHGPTVILLHGYTQTSRMPACKTKPSYYLVASDDKMIPPLAQRKMAERVKARGTEVAGSHAVYVSKPREVAEIIEKAAASSN
jgi:hypothetical protein